MYTPMHTLYHTHACNTHTHLLQVAKKAARQGLNLLKIKKLYVLTALLVHFKHFPSPLSGHLYKQDTFICPKCHICTTSEMRTPHYSGQQSAPMVSRLERFHCISLLQIEHHHNRVKQGGQLKVNIPSDPTTLPDKKKEV